MANTDDMRIQREHEQADQDEADRRFRSWARKQDDPMVGVRANDAILVRDFPGLFG